MGIFFRKGRGDPPLPAAPEAPRERLRAAAARYRAALAFAAQGHARQAALWEAEKRFHLARNEGNQLLSDFALQAAAGQSRQGRLIELESLLAEAHTDVQLAQEAIKAYAEDDSRAHDDMLAAKAALQTAALEVVLEEIVPQIGQSALRAEEHLLRCRAILYALGEDADRYGVRAQVRGAAERALGAASLGAPGPEGAQYVEARARREKSLRDMSLAIQKQVDGYLARLMADAEIGIEL